MSPFAVGDMVLQYYDFASSAYIDVSGSEIPSDGTSPWRESGVFNAVTAQHWRLYISTAEHYYQMYIC